MRSITCLAIICLAPFVDANLLMQVLAEVSQLRSGWAQAKQIIKQQRRTIKSQEVQLQLLSNGMVTSGPGQAADQSVVPMQGGDDSSKYPITSFILQRHQQLQQQQQALQRQV